MLVYLPMNALSGSNTRLESVPPWLAKAMQSLRSTLFRLFRAVDPLSRVGIDEPRGAAFCLRREGSTLPSGATHRAGGLRPPRCHLPVVPASAYHGIASLLPAGPVPQLSRLGSLEGQGTLGGVAVLASPEICCRCQDFSCRIAPFLLRGVALDFGLRSDLCRPRSIIISHTRRSAIELDNAPESQTNSITVLTSIRQNNSLKLLGYGTTAG